MPDIQSPKLVSIEAVDSSGYGYFDLILTFNEDLYYFYFDVPAESFDLEINDSTVHVSSVSSLSDRSQVKLWIDFSETIQSLTLDYVKPSSDFFADLSGNEVQSFLGCNPWSAVSYQHVKRYFYKL